MSNYLLNNYNKKYNTIFGYLGLFMAFNNVLFIGINIASLIFVFMFFKYKSENKLFNSNLKIHFFVLLFIIGVFISIIDSNSQFKDSDAFNRGLIVFPNYLLWCFLILYVSTSIHKINLLNLSGKIFIGIIFSMITYRLNLDLPFLKNNTPNSYAFVLVCFTAISVKYIDLKFGRIYSFLVLFIVLLSLLDLERRAGFILVLFSSFFTLYTDKIKFSQMITFSLIFTIFLLLFQLDIIKNSLSNASPRIYELIYENDDIAKNDDSYLVRRAQVEKGLIMFQENPLTGIGVNNFSKYEVRFVGNFEGSELVINKDDLSGKSAHNSYVNLLAEGGLFLIIPFLLILLYNIYHFFYAFNYRTKLENAYYFSFFAMTIHIYFISEILNVYAWFLIALVSGISLKYNKEIIK